jgi:hypothetical protein
VVMTKSWESNTVPKRAAESIRLTGGVRHGQRTKASTRERPKQIMKNAGGPWTPDNTPFPFFELPLEIRDQVYSSLVVRQGPGRLPVLDATALLKDRKKRLTAAKARNRLNQQRLSSGRRPTCARTTIPEPILHLDLLRVSGRLYQEATDCMYTNNWFAVSLAKLPSTAFDMPDGWNLSRVKRLQIEVQVKDAIRMNRYIDWASFFSTFPSLRFVRIIPTFHSRYYEWAYPELGDWRSTHYVHKAFFRELLATVPGHIDLKIGLPSNVQGGMEPQGNAVIDTRLLWDMYTELGRRVDSVGKLLAVNHVVQ